MNYLALIGLISAICGILSFAITIFSKYPWGQRIIWGIFVVVVTFISGLLVHKNSENERIKNIHRQANAICEHYSSSYSDEFIQESLVFLEENRDLYPDSYKRAEQIYSDMNNSIVQYDFEKARKLYGIINGIAALNGVK